MGNPSAWSQADFQEAPQDGERMLEAGLSTYSFERGRCFLLGVRVGYDQFQGVRNKSGKRVKLINRLEIRKPNWC